MRLLDSYKCVISGLLPGLYIYQRRVHSLDRPQYERVFMPTTGVIGPNRPPKELFESHLWVHPLCAGVEPPTLDKSQRRFLFQNFSLNVWSLSASGFVPPQPDVCSWYRLVSSQNPTLIDLPGPLHAPAYAYNQMWPSADPR